MIRIEPKSFILITLNLKFQGAQTLTSPCIDILIHVLIELHEVVLSENMIYA